MRPATRRAGDYRKLSVAVTILFVFAAVVPLAGCGRRSAARGGPATERSGTRGTLRYRLRSQVEPARVTLGDRAVWRLEADFPATVSIGSLIHEAVDSSLDIAEREKPRRFRRGGGTHWTAAFTVRGFNLGPIVLPRLSLPVRMAAMSDALEFPQDSLFVDSLTAAPTGAMEPDRGPLPTELRPLDLALVIAGILFLAAMLTAASILIARARSRARGAASAPTAEPPEPPGVQFLRALGALRAEIQSLPRDLFYERLSLALRAYAAAVTGIPALDRTTRELEREFFARPDLNREAVASLTRALRRSDLAKFARQEDPLAEALAALDEASALVGRLTIPSEIGA